MIELTPHPEGVLLAVRAQPGARANRIRGIQNGMLKVAVTQIPEKGKANEAVAKTLAEGLGLKRSQVELASGATSREKKFLIKDMTSDELLTRIQAIIAD